MRKSSKANNKNRPRTTRKSRKSNFNQVENKRIVDLQEKIFKAVNHEIIKKNPLVDWRKIPKPILAMNKIKKLVNTKTIAKSSKGYTDKKGINKIDPYLEKLGYNLTERQKILSRISKSSILERRKKDILNNWELAKNDKTYSKMIDYLIKVNRIAENNNYEIFKHAKIITDTFGRSYTLPELLNISKDFVNKTRNNLINLDYYTLKNIANKKTLKKIKDILIEKFLNERDGNIGQFYFNFGDIDWTQSKKNIFEQIKEAKAVYFDKTGQEEVEYTKYFEIRFGYIDSEKVYTKSVQIKNQYALEELRRLYREDPQKFYDALFEDTAKYYGIFDSINEALKGNLNGGYDYLGEEFDEIKKDVARLVNFITKNYIKEGEND